MVKISLLVAHPDPAFAEDGFSADKFSDAVADIVSAELPVSAASTAIVGRGAALGIAEIVIDVVRFLGDGGVATIALLLGLKNVNDGLEAIPKLAAKLNAAIEAVANSLWSCWPERDGSIVLAAGAICATDTVRSIQLIDEIYVSVREEQFIHKKFDVSGSVLELMEPGELLACLLFRVNKSQKYLVIVKRSGTVASVVKV